MFLPMLLAMAIGSVPRAEVRIDADGIGPAVSPHLYGIFFEEVNCAGDGGLYAELVRNRSFEDSDKPNYWHLVQVGQAPGSIVVEPSGTQKCLRLTFEGGGGKFAAANDGYWGIPVRAGEVYQLSLRARSDGKPQLLEVAIEDGHNNVHAVTHFDKLETEWETITARLKSTATDADARLIVRPVQAGTVWIDDVSLFPAKTFNSRPNGLRPDLAQMLADLKPAFVRFPGGCWVEGDTMATSLRWKQTVGELRTRRTQPNLWGYTSTNGLGYHEYLQLCEDLGAAPLFVINCGMSHREVVPMAGMDEFVQDALDAIEYANGPADSKWGSLRARSGHLAPFGLKFLEIGNENGGPAYAERFPLIARAIKARHPEIEIVANVWGGYPKGPLTEIIDEHYYSNPQFFIRNANRYDTYDRKGPKVYVGEYACTEGCGTGNLAAAVGEAAFMTGLERNSDIVKMASYAPLFANVNHKTWNPDLINFDGTRCYGTPSYYVQQMFSLNRADRVLPCDVKLSGVEKQSFSSGGVGVGTWGTQAEFKDVRVVADGRVLFGAMSGLRPGAGTWALDGEVLRQSGPQEGARAGIGATGWRRYSLTLKARKTGGREGFLITCGFKDERNWIWWNIGGWGNGRHAIEQCVDGSKAVLGDPVSGSVETGRWYDIRIDYSPERMRCFLDGRLIHDVACPQPLPLHVVAGRAGQDVIVKAVNSGSLPLDLDLNLRRGTGARIEPSGTWTLLTSPDPSNENTLDSPRRVSPTTRRLRGSKLTLPPWSVSVVRVRAT